MIVAGSASPLLLSSAGGYNLTNSLRFRSSASAYLNRTFGSPTLSTKWTWSGWFKLGYASTYYTIFDGGSPDTRFGRDPSTNQLYVNNDTTNFIITTPVYRDYSAWYHAVLAFDSSQGTASNRLRLYINGSEVTAFATDNRSSISGAIGINTATAHGIGRQPSGGSAYFDGYMAEINFIDGQQLTPSSFGETSATTGVWQPIKFTGTYGNNGFYLDFEDTSSTAALGYDAAGSNDWTVNNISLTAGSTYDSMTDVPTLTSATAANYAVLNPLMGASVTGATLSNGNLAIAGTGQTGHNQGTFGSSSGKFYWECNLTTFSNNDFTMGAESFGSSITGVVGTASTSYAIYNYSSNTYIQKRNNNSNTNTNTTVAAQGDTLMVAVDVDAGKIWWGKNGTWIDSGDPSTGANAMFTGVSGTITPATTCGTAGGSAVTLSYNFGQQPFAYTPPTGFVRLNTFNLPTPTIGATASTTANKYFDATTYTGTGASLSITNGGSMQPDWVWIKQRSGTAQNHYLVDAVRGNTKQLASNLTNAESTANNALTSFNSNGFTVGTNTDGYNVNANTQTYIGWQWKANGAGSTNTAGSITSTVSANTSAGFSIVTYTGTGANATVGHGLGVAPSMVIYKRRSASDGWAVYFSSIGATNNLVLQSTAAQQANGNVYWNSTAPTSTVFTAGTDSAVNASTATYVAYCFAQIAGYSAFGSYTGNGSSDGPFIFTGFRPRFVMFKGSSIASNWCMLDSSRNTYNLTDATLQANDSAAELTNLSDVDFLSNGIKIRDVVTNDTNVSGETYIYMAFAENPFKYANAR